MESRQIKVQIISPCLTSAADAPYSTRMRARAMQAAGLDVEVFAYPDVYPEHAGDLGVNYSGIHAEVSEDSYRRAQTRSRRWGAYWGLIFEPYLVMNAGCRRALKRKCDIVYIADVEPWVTLIFCLQLKMQQYPLPIAGQTPGQYMGFMKVPLLRTKVRYGLNYFASRFLPHFMDLLGTSRHILSTLKIDKSPRAHVMLEGHENRIGWRTVSEARAILGLPTDVRMILLFGVAGRGKGADILIRALENVPPDIMVCIVGKTGGLYESSWGDVSKLRQAGWCENRLRIVDRFVTEEEMQNYYAACNAVVIPYRAPFVGTSTHLRRASEHGKAIIACDQYHMGGCVREYGLGLTFDPDSSASLAEKLLVFKDKPQSWFDQILINSQHLLAEESWERIGVKYRDLFDEMMKYTRNRNQVV